MMETDNIVLAGGLSSNSIDPEFRILASADDNVAEAYCVSELPFTNCLGDITGVTAGTGISGGGTSGTVTVALDLGELSVGGNTNRYWTI